MFKHENLSTTTISLLRNQSGGCSLFLFEFPVKRIASISTHTTLCRFRLGIEKKIINIYMYHRNALKLPHTEYKNYPVGDINRWAFSAHLQCVLNSIKSLCFIKHSPEALMKKYQTKYNSIQPLSHIHRRFIPKHT